jgi:hypothetical protein
MQLTKIQNFFYEKLGIKEYVSKDLSKARDLYDKTRREAKSLFLNPYYMMAATGLWRERPTRLTYHSMRMVADKNPIVGSIINTRIAQVATFSRPMSIVEKVAATPLGFKVVHKEKPDDDLSKEEKGLQHEIEQFLWNSGSTDRLRNGDRRPSFDHWLRMSVRDSLTFDQMVTELVPNRKGEPAEFWAVDAATIRRAVPTEDGKEDPDQAFVQVVNGQIQNTYKHSELAFCVRNPQTDMYANKYGKSEIEQLLNIVTAYLNAEMHNRKFFEQGSAIKGILNVKGEQINQPMFEAFKREWHAQVTGSTNAWKTPVMQAPSGVEFINLHASNREMEFIKWLDFLIKITCAIYMIDPAEINFDLRGGTGQSTATFESNPIEAKLKLSRDKGLRPLLVFMMQVVNEYIMAPRFPEWIFSFHGIDAKKESEIIELRSKEVKAYKKLDEIRAEAGLKPMGEENGGELILDPQYIQWLQQKQMQAMEASGGFAEDEEGGLAEEGEPTDEGGGRAGGNDGAFGFPEDFEGGGGGRGEEAPKVAAAVAKGGLSEDREITITIENDAPRIEPVIIKQEIEKSGPIRQSIDTERILAEIEDLKGAALRGDRDNIDQLTKGLAAAVGGIRMPDIVMPEITVNVPEQPAPDVNVTIHQKGQNLKVVRDGDGLLSRVEVSED